MKLQMEAKLAFSTVGEGCPMKICMSIDKNCFTFLSVIYDLQNSKVAPTESDNMERCPLDGM